MSVVVKVRVFECQLTISDHIAVLINADLQCLLSDDAASSDGCLLDFWKLCKEEDGSNGDSGACDGKIHVLYIGQVVDILAREEGLRCNKWTDLL